MRYLPNAAAAARMNTDELRAHFLVSGLFVPGEIRLALVAPTAFLAEYFTERRELGVLNIGGAGSVTVDGERHALGRRDVLYVGRGSREVGFASDDAATPARFYLVSYPAHASHQTTRVTAAEAEGAAIGAQETAN